MKEPNSRPNPYVGPRAFLIGEKLHGRDRELRELLNFLLSQRIVLLYSPSGAGKTSLVQAGLIPALAEKSFTILPVIRVNQEPPPLEEIKQDTEADTPSTFNRYIYSALLSLEEGLPEEKLTPTKTLASLSLEDYLAQRPVQESESESEQPKVEVLVFDQFEEILTIDPTDQDSKAAFFAQVGDTLLHRHRWVLFSMREDYIAALDPYLRLLPTHLRSRYRLDLLGVDSALQAIQHPARLAGATFSDPAAAKLVNDLRQVQVQRQDGSLDSQPGPYVEPVQLQVVCRRLWENLAPDDNEISEEDVSQIGDVNQSLSEYYTEELNTIAAQTGQSERAIREWFERKLITEQGFRSQVLMGSKRSEGLENQTIRQLVDAFLVRAEKRRGATWFELAHDRLIEPVRRSNAAWFQANLSPLQRQAALWEEKGKPEGLLWTDQTLIEAQDWASKNRDALTSLENEFLQACQVAYQHLVREKRNNRLIRFLAIGALLAAVLAIYFMFSAVNANQGLEVSNKQLALSNLTQVAAVATSQANAQAAEAAQETAQAAYLEAVDQRSTAVAAQATAQAAFQEAVDQRTIAEAAKVTAQANYEEAQRQSEIALSRQLAVQAQGYQRNQPDLAALLAIEAYRSADTFEARDALLTNLQQKVAGTLQELAPPIPADRNDISAVSLSSDGQHLAYGTTGGVIVIWNYRDQQVSFKKDSDEAGRIITLDWNPDGQRLAYAAGDGRIYMLKLPSSTEQAGLSSPEELFPGRQRVPIWRIPDLSYSPDGNRLAFGAGTDVVVLDTSRQTESRYTFGATIESVDWSPDGIWLALGLADNTVRVLKAVTLETSFLYRAGPTITRSKAFSPWQRQMSVAWSPINSDSPLLAMAGQPGKIVVLDVSQGKLVAEEDTKQEIYSLAFASDGGVIATGGIDSLVKLWRVPDLEPIDEISKHNRMVVDLDFSPILGNALVASASYDNSAGLFQLAQPSPLAEELSKESGSIIGLSISPDGSPQTVVLDSKSNGIGSYALKEEPISYALNNSGALLALGFADGRIEILDLDTGTPASTFQAVPNPVLALAWNPDERTIALSYCTEQSQNFAQQTLCDQNEIGFLDIQSGVVTNMPQVYDNYLRTLAYAPQAGLLASGSDDRSIQIWDPVSGSRAGVSLVSHQAGITSLVFSPDGRLLASGGSDQTLILWDTQANAPIGEPLTGFSDKITSLAFSPDGLALYTGLSDGTLLRWDFDPNSWVARNCALAGEGRYLSEAEWAQFLPSMNYNPSCTQSP